MILHKYIKILIRYFTFVYPRKYEGYKSESVS